MQALAGILGLKNLTIKSYSINQSQVLGQGAFGIVYKGADSKKNLIAAKRIDGKVHQRIFEQDYERLLELDHENIAKTLDFEMDGDIFWMFMPFYEKGDLNKFYRTHDVTIGTCHEIMKQIMSGVAYLHENNIIHRDIKPGNILVASDLPVLVKLTDFDVTKFLDPDIETSLMSSNVGTNAFKAPEFFMRNEERKIQYHRNVDVYAAGLTFLAMLQFKKPATMLIPRIETPTEDSELFVPIGQLVAERIRYRVEERKIAVDGKDKVLMDFFIRKLIQNMTCENPNDRLAAADCLAVLKRMLEKAGTFHTKLDYAYSMFVSGKNQIIVAGTVDGKNVIRVMDGSGRFMKDILSFCSTSSCKYVYCVVEHPTKPNCVLESCGMCDVIRIYRVNTGKGNTIFTGWKPRTMCRGPDDSVLVCNFGGEILQLKSNSGELQQIHNIKVRLTDTFLRSMTYIQDHDILVVLNHNFIKATKLSDGSVLWTKEYKGSLSCAAPSDSNGRVYICTSNGKLPVIDAINGNVLKKIKWEVSDFSDVCWTSFQPQLRVLTSCGEMKCYNVE